MIIRRSQLSDFLEIAALDRVAWKQNRNSEFIPDGEHIWRIWVEHAVVFVAEENNEIVGVVQACACNTTKLYSFHKAFVKQELRNKGIGSKLLERLCHEADEKKFNMYLTVDPENERAQTVYEKYGFAKSEFVKGYYRPEEDRIVMKRMS